MGVSKTESSLVLDDKLFEGSTKVKPPVDSLMTELCRFTTVKTTTKGPP